MSFGDVIKSAALLAYRPFGIGGTENIIWQCEYDDAIMYQLSTDDLSVVRSESAPAYSGYGVGGTENIIWWCRSYPFKRIYELSTTDFSAIRWEVAPSESPSGIGGDANTIWHCDYTSEDLYELSTTDFSVVRSESAMSSSPLGIGGDANTIWHCDGNTNAIYDLSISDFSADRVADAPGPGSCGIGGDANTIWWVEWIPSIAYELDIGILAPVADFSGTPISGYVPLTVQFTDLSTNGPTSWLWDFGDGETSTEQNPSHSYNDVGIYTVTLTATNAAGSDTEIKTDYITVLLGANFSAQPLTGKYPLTVHFTDLSLYGPTSWLWDFGDREISKEQNPIHIYKEAGLYTVSLTATNEAGSDTETKFGYIEAIERSFIEKRGIEERQQMKIRHISLKRGLAIAERIPIRVIEVRRDPAPKRIWK